MTAVSSFAPDPQNSALRASLVRHAPLAIALLITTLLTLLRLSGTVDSDVAWQLWTAHQVNGGAHLYRDIVEVNPPLWFWMALPVDALASALHVRVEAVCIAEMGVLSALALAATARLTTGTDAQRTLFLGYAAVILMAMPWMHVGQREQIVLIGSLPYAALIAARQNDSAIPAALASAIGAGAALGFALKPYFLGVPILLELWLIAGLRNQWRPLRPESLALAGTGLAYALAVLALARDYLTSTLPLVRLAYGVTGAPRLVDLFQPAVLTSLVAMAVVAIDPGMLRKRGPALAVGLLVAAGGFAIVYFVQAKGWPYHALPLLGCASLALMASLTGGDSPPRLTRIAAPALIILPLLLAFVETRREPTPGADLLHAVEGMQPGDSVGFIATDPALPWSIVLQRQLTYPSRYIGFWMMRAVVTNEARGGPDWRLTELGRRVVTETVADFRCRPPRRIIVARPRLGEAGFDILPFFERDATFRSLLSHYRPVRRTSLEVFDQATAYPALPPSECRKMHRAVR